MATYPSYIPAPDADFDNWLANFSTVLTANPTDFGLDAADATAVAGVTTTWSAAYALAIDPGTRTTPIIAAKDVARAAAEAVVRPYAVQISRNAAVTDLNKSTIGVTIPSLVRTPIPPPVEQPTIALKSAITGVQTLTYKVAGQVGKSKPFGSIGVQLFRSVGTVAATDPAQAAYQGTYTKSPLRQQFTAPDAGKVVTYFARFVTKSGPEGTAQVGPWSDPLNLIVM